VNKL
jgi:hypothetical protein